jgi:cobalt-zinc-cadmium efflux system protein
VIASFINGLALCPIAAYVLWEAYARWRNPEPIKLEGMLAVGAVGLVANLLSAAFLHRHSKEDLNVRGAFLHMIADSASSVGVLAAGAVIYFFRWPQIDPLIAAFISVMIVVWAMGLIRDSMRILLESVPKHMNLEEIRARMKSEEGVAEVHDLHVWTITSKMYALTAHVILKEDMPVGKTESIAHRLQHLLDGEYDINHVTLQFETNHKAEHCAHEHEPAAHGHGHEH